VLRAAPTTADLRAFAGESAWLEAFIRPISGLAPQKTVAGWERDGPERLARMRTLLRLLGDPQEQFLTLHVAGTSGKGSVCTYLGAVLRAAGLRTGVHTTPYLQTPVEKLQVDGLYASPVEFVALVERFRALLGLQETAAAPPVFEGLAYPALWVALTYLYFAMQEVRVGVIEASAGARWDWTNTLRPEVAVVTTVGPDHLNTLGPTLNEVAYHKAGAIRPGVPAISGVAPPERATIEREAQQQGARLRRLGVEFDLRLRSSTADGTLFDYIDNEQPRNSIVGLETTLLGRHQAGNAALAVAALQLFAEQHGSPNEAAIRAGLREARIPGRMELMQRRPDVLLDGAHNPEKAAALAASLAEIYLERRLIIVLGALSSKDATGILQPLARQARLAIVTAPHVLGKPAADPARMAAESAALGISTLAGGEPLAALDLALNHAQPDDIVLVTGSLYLVGEIRRRWVPDDSVLATGLSRP
jgi:dihydrofolate synthase / folylpolyglutamate synthase